MVTWSHHETVTKWWFPPKKSHANKNSTTFSGFSSQLNTLGWWCLWLFPIIRKSYPSLWSVSHRLNVFYLFIARLTPRGPSESRIWAIVASWFFFGCLPLFLLALSIFYVVVFRINRYSSHAVNTHFNCVYDSSTTKLSQLWTYPIYYYYSFFPWIARTASLFSFELFVRFHCLRVLNGHSTCKYSWCYYEIFTTACRSYGGSVTNGRTFQTLESVFIVSWTFVLAIHDCRFV